MMQRPFIGFSNDKQKTVRVPEGFFEDVLPQISSMLEMKVTLYLFRCLAQMNKAGTPRMVSLAELELDGSLRSTLAQGKGPRPWEEALREGLELAVARGTLLKMWVREEPNDISDGYTGQWFMLNTKDHRTWIEALGNGQIAIENSPLAERLSEMLHTSRHNGHSQKLYAVAERPSIYGLYEQNIGLLTPILAEKLQEAEGRYPPQWIEEAFSEAVLNNKRSWRYIERILERWSAEGHGGQDRGLSERSLDPDKYTKGKYAFLFRPEG
ncbi:MAG: DnaD domain protein [Chloroflexota bacterium]|nr:DnaD domain protein [Chloroflexota bacterium]